GHDFDSARRSYKSHAASSYSKAVDKGTTLKDLVPKNLSTKSSNPLVIITDETGSMGDWPATIFSKLPYLEHEAKTEYLGEDVEISWGAIGDAHNNENYPLQARPFSSGTELAEKLKELVIEGCGGGTGQETYELAALYYARNIEMPNAIKPVLIFIGDESPYDSIDPTTAQIAQVNLQEKITTKQVFEELKEKFSVYFVQKPYGGEHFTDGALTGTTKRVHKDWVALVGEDHIALLSDPGRVVDVIFGILAKEAGKIRYFKTEIEDRQTPAQVKSVYTALNTIHHLPKGKNSVPLLGSGKSVLTRKH
ncbi:MAG: hypothetical protein AAB522_03255, partial [Patescibacteria group bacterium]